MGSLQNHQQNQEIQARSLKLLIETYRFLNKQEAQKELERIFVMQRYYKFINIIIYKYQSF